MGQLEVAASAAVDAAPDVVYRIIADYRDGHRRIVPPRYFTWLAVEEGGVGAGTRIAFAMRAFGSTRTTRGVVSEPAPGTRIVETYPESGIVTAFIVEPGARPGSARVTISTTMPVRDGMAGRFERFMASRFLTRVYREELQRLADVAERRVMHPPVPDRPAGAAA